MIHANNPDNTDFKQEQNENILRLVTVIFKGKNISPQVNFPGSYKKIRIYQSDFIKSTFKSNRLELFFRNSVLKNLKQFSEKHRKTYAKEFFLPKHYRKIGPSQNFPVNFAKIFRTCSKEHRRRVVFITNEMKS